MWFNIQEQQVIITVFARPNARKTGIMKIDREALCISIHGKPHQGTANRILIDFLARLFHLPKTQIILRKGERSRYKQVIVPLTSHVQNFINQYANGTDEEPWLTT